MAWKPRRKKWPWKEFLTPDERSAVDAYEVRAAGVKAQAAALSAAKATVDKIRNRAIQRAKFDAGAKR